MLVKGGRHEEGAKGVLMAKHGAWWRVKPSEDTARDGTARAIVSVLQRDLEMAGFWVNEINVRLVVGCWWCWWWLRL